MQTVFRAFIRQFCAWSRLACKHCLGRKFSLWGFSVQIDRCLGRIWLYQYEYGMSILGEITLLSCPFIISRWLWSYGFEASWKWFTASTPLKILPWLKIFLLPTRLLSNIWAFMVDQVDIIRHLYIIYSIARSFFYFYITVST